MVKQDKLVSALREIVALMRGLGITVYEDKQPNLPNVKSIRIVRQPTPTAPGWPALLTSCQREPTIAHQVIPAPISGLFLRGLPGQPPLISQGDRVTPGQTVCLIEAFYTQSEIPCPKGVAGILTKVCLENMSEVVEGEELFWVRTS